MRMSLLYSHKGVSLLYYVPGDVDKRGGQDGRETAMRLLTEYADRTASCLELFTRITVNHHSLSKKIVNYYSTL